MRKSQRHHHHHKPMDVVGPAPSESGFSYALTRVAVAQICQSVGYKGAQKVAIEALTDIAARHLKAVAKSAAACANRHGRTESNLPDIVVALEDLESVQGFPGAWSLRTHSLYASTVVKNLARFVSFSNEIPFAQPLPPRKRFCRRDAEVKILKCGGGGDGKGRWYVDGSSLRHVPRWLPSLPAVEVQDKGEGREREGRWGCLDGGVEKERENRGGVRVEREGNSSGGIEMVKRGKVVFKIGATTTLGMVGVSNSKGVGNGVCRGGGIGKRVQCSSNSSRCGANGKWK